MIVVLAVGAISTVAYAATPWIVMTPPKPPPGSVVECQAGGKLNNLCGFISNGDLAAWATDNRLLLFDAKTGKRRLDLRIKDGTVASSMNAAGAVLVFGSVAEVWDFSGERPPQKPSLRVEHHPGRFAFSPDGTTLAMGAYSLVLRDIRTGRQLREIEIPPDPVTSNARSTTAIAFSRDGKVVAAAVSGSCPAVLSWLTATGAPHGGVVFDPGNRAEIRSISLSSNGNSVAVMEVHQLPPPVEGSIGFTFKTSIHDLASGKQLLNLSSRATVCDSGAWIVCQPEGTADVQVYEFTTGRLHATLPDCGGPMVASRVLAARVAEKTSSMQTNFFGLWDLDTGKLTASARLDAHYSSLLAISPDAQFLAIGATEGLCIVSMATGGKVLELRARPRRQRVLAFSSVVFSPDSTRVAFRISNIPYGDRDDCFGMADLRMLSPSAVPVSTGETSE
jgi:WD40 repeat protein